MFSRSLPVSIAVHLSVLVLLFIIPLAAEVVLPLPPMRLPPYVKAVAIPPPPALPAAVVTAPSRTFSTETAPPIAAPHAILPEVAPPGTFSALGDPFGVSGPPMDVGAIGEITRTIQGPPPPAEPRPRGPVRVGELLVMPRKIVDVRPAYPEIARMSRVQGTVVLEAVLDRAGRVSQVRVVRSAPFLDQAAIDAVRQWRYTPSVFHGQPVDVLMTISITFHLQ